MTDWNRYEEKVLGELKEIKEDLRDLKRDHSERQKECATHQALSDEMRRGIDVLREEQKRIDAVTAALAADTRAKKGMWTAVAAMLVALAAALWQAIKGKM